MRISDWSSDVCSSDLVGFDGAQADSHFGGYIALEDAVDAETAKDARGPLAGGGNRLFDERELLTRDERSLCRRFLDRRRLAPRRVAQLALATRTIAIEHQAVGGAHRSPARPRDRKSTRLNSSH